MRKLSGLFLVFIVFFLFSLSIVVVVLLIKIGCKKNFFPLCRNLKKDCQSFYSIFPNESVFCGKPYVSDDSSMAIVSGDLLKVFQSKGNVYLDVLFSDNRKERILIFSDDFGSSFFLKKQRTRDLFPLSKDYEVEKLNNSGFIINKFEKIKQKPMLFSFVLRGLNENESSEFFQNCERCNNSFVNSLLGKGSDLNCSPCVFEISYYENSGY